MLRELFEASCFSGSFFVFTQRRKENFH